MVHSGARATACVTNDEIEAKAKALCVDDGFDPAQNVTHAYGDDFTAQEWESWWTSNPAIPFQSVVSPMWRLYRARAISELLCLRKVVETSDNVVPFRRRNSVDVLSTALER
jgi:hypothetical protein